MPLSVLHGPSRAAGIDTRRESHAHSSTQQHRRKTCQAPRRIAHIFEQTDEERQTAQKELYADDDPATKS
jgi:hypothetical protein